jgi:hypothetical protein
MFSKRFSLVAGLAGVALSCMAAGCAHRPAPPSAPPTSMINHGFSAAEPPIEVLLLGIFHFDQTDTLELDVLKEPRASEVARVSKALAQWKPDKIFVEWQAEFNQALADSLMAMPTVLGPNARRNEIVQLGMRTALDLGQQRVFLVDHPGRYNSLRTVMRAAAAQYGQQSLLDGTAPYTRKALYEVDQQSTHMARRTIPEFLRYLNSPEYQTLDQGVYVGRYARVGQTRTDLLDTTRTPNAGAELVADWYRRNVMIYSKMLKWMDFKERRIVLIIGNGHVPILKHLFQSHGGFRVVTAADILPKR